MHTKIKVSMAPGEREREQDLRIALSHDPRFEPLQIDSSIPVDLHFSFEVDCKEPFCIEGHDESYAACTNCGGTAKVNKVLNMELKEPQDFVQSVLSGHLYDQTLSIRESCQNGCTVILGGLEDIYEAIKQSATGRGVKRSEIGHVIATTHSRCKSFRKRSFLNGVPIFYIGDDSGFFDNLEEDDKKNKIGVWKDILELAADYLADGDMLGFRVRPADNEREVAAASMLRKGIGSDSMRVLLKEYTLAFVPRGIYAKPIEELPNWGPKRCQQIADMVRMIYR